jgi:AcrR family transcriptional regulator
MSRKLRAAISCAVAVEICGSYVVVIDASSTLDRRRFYSMEEYVKGGRRTYDATGRRRSSRTRQVQVADVTARLVVERGYAGLTMAALAAEAGVSVPWLYKVFGPKPALVKRAYDLLLAGDPDPVPMAQRPAFLALAAETDPARAVTRYAAIARDLASRAGPYAAALVTAARAGEPELADFAATIDRERLFGATRFAEHLAALGGLAPTVSTEQARDFVWTQISPDVYRMLVLERGWSAGTYERWLARTLAGALLALERRG